MVARFVAGCRCSFGCHWKRRLLSAPFSLYPGPSLVLSNLLLQVKQCTAWCSEIGSLTSLDACYSGACSDIKEPISLHQDVYPYQSLQFSITKQTLLFERYFSPMFHLLDSSLDEGGRLHMTSLCASHISSIRSLASLLLSDDSWLLVSGGGRSQIKCSVVGPSDGSSTAGVVDSELGSSSVNRKLCLLPLTEFPPVLSQRESRQRRKNPPSDILESRVMSLAAFDQPLSCIDVSEGSPSPQLQVRHCFVAAGYSDGLLR